MLRRSTTLAAAVLMAGALALTACSASPSPAPSTSAAADPDASVAVRLVAEPGNLDIRETAGAALDQLLIDNVYQGLVSRTPEQDIVPALASDYEVSPDGLTYTFTLREGVVFHDGQPLTPQDVVWSLTQVRDTPSYRDSDRLAGVTGIAVDGQDIVLTLAEPDSSLLWNLTGRAGLILKEGDTIDRKTAANGTGPFTLSSWKQGDSVTLQRFEQYWGDPAGAAEVVFAYIPENQAALNAALAGEVDVVTGFDANLAEQIEANGDFTVEVGASTDKGTLAMNASEGPLADVQVRQAIRQAIDHDAIVEAIGAGQTQYGPIPELDPGYEDLSDVAPFDPDAARELLEEAGADDLELTLTIPSFYGTTVSQILVSNLHDVGVTLKVDAVEFSSWLNDVYINKDFDLSFVLHTEARDFENWANPDYYFGYDNAEVQELFAQSLAATDEAEAAELLAEAARIVSEDHVADWLYNGASVVAVGASISGMPTVNVNERLNLAELTKSEG
ncbi:ABC transporter substrate-binding protein [Microbacterium sp. zg.Y1090]|uniref:ABC transporter substrate-binding protein n=1 Tax=Microbacterium TaxID=33882 RepID=UPI00214BFB6E|nr:MULTISPECIES: ABC transporter substrate-binding protein [unclassified Microbacterium]MCR2813515.1 ABC transporter substrate-binding protein [Microbacterium sp. zg.Y1084]MCR2818148.1 ABC transporter substrate-binding protein [Microbacterium sp. zg.Y1090]MDL5486670.1 ABC transporter substrate-binding protein [Microbacterium sp. zg-Y1211]WIM27699.1 ABC transporter substrate-binding protein [Microbacterium sp. zg-Y1090]